MHTRSKSTLRPGHLSDTWSEGWMEETSSHDYSISEVLSCLSGSPGFICMVTAPWKPSHTISSEDQAEGLSLQDTVTSTKLPSFAVLQGTAGTQRRVLVPWHSMFGLGNCVMDPSWTNNEHKTWWSWSPSLGFFISTAIVTALLKRKAGKYQYSLWKLNLQDGNSMAIWEVR